MDIVLAVLVLAAALAGLAYPLYRARTQAFALNASTLDDLLAQRDGVYATLRDLELDQQLGKLDAADYHALHEKYMTRASEILRRVDMLRGEGTGKQVGAEIEQEIAVLRRRTPAGEGRAKQPPAPVPTVLPPDLHCTNCGRAYKLGDKFCARCGHATS